MGGLIKNFNFNDLIIIRTKHACIKTAQNEESQIFFQLKISNRHQSQAQIEGVLRGVDQVRAWDFWTLVP